MADEQEAVSYEAFLEMKERAEAAERSLEQKHESAAAREEELLNQLEDFRTRLTRAEADRDFAQGALSYTQSPTEFCKEERARGSGGCGVCGLCCGELREQNGDLAQRVLMLESRQVNLRDTLQSLVQELSEVIDASGEEVDEKRVRETFDATSKGVRLVASERLRQINEEGWSAEHDDGHTEGSIAMAAACYAAPKLIYKREETTRGTFFVDPWPWEAKADKRPRQQKILRPHPPTPPSLGTTGMRIRNLVKAGALIAAEIDRLLRHFDRLRNDDENPL